jgi:hypothetical protein
VSRSGRELAVDLRIGVIVQSEFTTSLSKPNPFGKALVNTLPFGVWVDLEEQGRVRLDRVRFVRIAVFDQQAQHFENRPCSRGKCGCCCARGGHS